MIVDSDNLNLSMHAFEQACESANPTIRIFTEHYLHDSRPMTAHRSYVHTYIHTVYIPTCIRMDRRACVRTCVRACVRAHLNANSSGGRILILAPVLRWMPKASILV